MARTSRLSWAQLLAFVGPCLPLSAIGLPLLVHLPAYYAGHIGLPLSAVGLAFTSVRLVDIAVDPLAGSIMDRTRNRLGRFRTWLIASTPLLMLAAWMLFMVTPGASAAYLWVWLAVMYLGFSFGSLSQTAWAAMLSSDYHERSRIYGWWQSANVAGLLLVLMLPPLVQLGFDDGEAAGVSAMGWFILILLPLSVALAVWRVREPPAPPANSGQARFGDYFRLMAQPTVSRLVIADLLLGWAPGVTGILYLFYFREIKGVAETGANLLLLVFFASGLLFGPLWSWLAQRIGKHRALALGSVGIVVGELLILLVPFTSPGAAAVVMAAAGMSYSSGPLLLRAMMADVSDEVRLRTGRDSTGLLYAMLTATTKIGFALAGLSFVVLDAAGFRASGPNGPQALFWLQLMFIAAPAAFALLTALIVLGHPLDARRHGEILAALGET